MYQHFAAVFYQTTQTFLPLLISIFWYRNSLGMSTWIISQPLWATPMTLTFPSRQEVTNNDYKLPCCVDTKNLFLASSNTYACAFITDRAKGAKVGCYGLQLINLAPYVIGCKSSQQVYPQLCRLLFLIGPWSKRDGSKTSNFRLVTLNTPLCVASCLNNEPARKLRRDAFILPSLRYDRFNGREARDGGGYNRCEMHRLLLMIRMKTDNKRQIIPQIHYQGCAA